MIMSLAGRRIDPIDAEVKRFPLENKEIVRQRILDLFIKENVTTLISSAACGADLLAQDVARELKIQQRIILPFSRNKFRQTSVTDRPGNWGKLYDEICDEVDANGYLVILKDEEDESKAYSRVTEKLIEQNNATKKINTTESNAVVVVWEGKVKNEKDETASFIREAKKNDIDVIEISTI